MKFLILSVAILPVFTPFASAKIADGLVVYLNFDDTTENAVPGPYVTKVIGSVATPHFAEGRFGKAAEFRGDCKPGVTLDWALALSPELEDIYAGDWSVSLWVKDAVPGDGVIIGNKDWNTGSNPGWVISSLPSNYKDTSKPVTQLGKINWTPKDGGRHDYIFTPKNTFIREGWHHVAITCSHANDEMAVYRDGERMNGDGSDHTLKLGFKAAFSAGFTTVIGAGRDGTFGSTVVVDEVGIWNRALAPWEVKTLSARTVKIPEPSVYGLLAAGALAGRVMVRRRRK